MIIFISYFFEYQLNIFNFYFSSQISIAKSAAYVVKYGPDNSLWLCQKNGVLSIVELEKIITFTEKYEPL